MIYFDDPQDSTDNGDSTPNGDTSDAGDAKSDTPAAA